MVATLQVKVKDQDRTIVNLVAALRQANARVILLEDMIAGALGDSDTPDPRTRDCGRIIAAGSRLVH
jgi:hypothetical protein